MECEICHNTHHFRRECPRGDGRGRGPSMHLAQTDSDMQFVDWETRLTDPADRSVANVNFMAAKFWSAGISLENYADEAFEEIFAGHSESDLAGWLGMPVAGRPSDIEL
eukprot:61869-Pyramimonas_sp.AAC.1